MKIKGIPVGTTMPRPDWNQTDSKKADYIHNKPDFEGHVTDQNNPHKVTADQVGARPDTWTPTAEDVGARPDDWLPTAEEVGAAPVGFGLGVVNEVSNPDDCVENGWYSSGVYSIFVQKINDNFIYQLRRSSDNYAEMTIETRQRRNGVWDEWVWINPPMVPDTEYRTTERFEGKSVYMKNVWCEYLPSKSQKTVKHNVSGATRFLSVVGCVQYGNGAPGHTIVSEGGVKVAADAINIVITTAWDASDYRLNVILKYIKD